jgi:hypothetical protein
MGPRHATREEQRDEVSEHHGAPHLRAVRVRVFRSSPASCPWSSLRTERRPVGPRHVAPRAVGAHMQRDASVQIGPEKPAGVQHVTKSPTQAMHGQVVHPVAGM